MSAEALLMLKERIGDRYGPIRCTMGAGCSGGSIQQHAIADAYPGVLDGLMPSCSFPDLWSPAHGCERLPGWRVRLHEAPAADPTAPITWPTFAGGPGGAPLGPAPRSAP